MATDPKPGDQPDPADKSDFKSDGEAGDPPRDEADLAAEEEAARLGDFA